ncbi:MAG TPA: glycosyltransferase family 2 protein [Vicinamibacterales bacterium]|nr:glycosyltransferase family 2 protein [Vicinamibacterales bacterium]
MRPRLSIVIVNFNGRGHLERCLASLAAHPPSVAHETVVVDNASTDGSAALVRGWPAVRLIELPANVGFSAGNNAGIRATSGELVLLLNNDTVVPAGALDTLVARLEAHPAAAIAGPRLVDGDGAAELSFGPMISPLGELRQKLIVGAGERGLRPARWLIGRATRRERYVDWVSGACLLVRRAVAEEVELLDERFFLYTEDVDFCASVRARGWKVLFTPAAEIVHLRGRSRATAARLANAAYRRSHLAFYEKHHPRWAPVLRWYLRRKGQLPTEPGPTR